MKDKITYLMKSEGLTTTRLSEILEIQPSAVSHLVSGRNNPRYDLIQKILTRFPQINPDWLLLDQGDPYRSESQLPSSESQAEKSAQNDDANGSTAGREDKSETNSPSLQEVQQRANRSGKSPIFVMVFYDDGSCENFSMRQ